MTLYGRDWREVGNVEAGQQCAKLLLVEGIRVAPPQARLLMVSWWSTE